MTMTITDIRPATCKGVDTDALFATLDAAAWTPPAHLPSDWDAPVPMGPAVPSGIGAPIDPAQLADTLARLARTHRVPGAQLAIHHAGETVAVNAGELKLGDGPVTQDAAFPVGSITKCFTATVSMMLVADGDVELDAPLSEHLPELDGLGEELTLRQVLSHTSGLTAACGPAGPADASPRRFLQHYCRAGNLVMRPGTAFSYSNVGYAVVGQLVEAITGMSWAEAVECILLRPLGIDPAFVVGSPRGSRSIAVGHSVNASVGRTRPVQQSLAPALAPAGALAVSAADLVSLGMMHIGEGVPDLLPAAWAAEMRRKVPGAEPFGLADGWGAGLAVFREPTAEWVGHDGNAEGTACALRLNPGSDCIVAFTSNANTGTGLWQDLLGELAGAGIPIGAARGWKSQEPPVGPPRGCTGTYVNGDDLEFAVVGDDGGHGVSLVIDGDRAPLTCYPDLTFTLPDPNSGRQVPGGRFTRDGRTGRIDGLQMGGRLTRRLDGSEQRVAAVLRAAA
jgi:CubicO group peptidase (beta-lactamase class C family)